MISVFSTFAQKGLFLRRIDREKTEKAQDDAIRAMEKDNPPIVRVEKDELILETVSYTHLTLPTILLV